jgi:hypothetical protein
MAFLPLARSLITFLGLDAVGIDFLIGAHTGAIWFGVKVLFIAVMVTALLMAALGVVFHAYGLLFTIFSAHDKLPLVHRTGTTDGK